MPLLNSMYVLTSNFSLMLGRPDSAPGNVKQETTPSSGGNSKPMKPKNLQNKLEMRIKNELIEQGKSRHKAEKYARKCK